MKKATTAYGFKDGSCISADPQKVGEMCEDLASTSGGLTPSRLVDANREDGTPLHKYFEWDDAKAAEGYRENQAAHVIRCITIREVVCAGKAPEPIRAFVKASPSDKKKYEPIQVVLANGDSSKYLIECARREALTFVRKYRQYSALRPMADAVEQAVNAAIGLNA